jgi:hypothetical protein
MIIFSSIVPRHDALPRVSPKVVMALWSRSGLEDGFDRIMAKCGFQSPHFSSAQLCIEKNVSLVHLLNAKSENAGKETEFKN